ncbi:MAG: hypothetical protein ABIA04_15375 [Pseudomonadota bacterium]
MDITGKNPIVIPEFPLRKGTIKNKMSSKFAEKIEDRHHNNSFKMDYLIISKNLNKILFVELKTDNNSIRKDQLDYLIAGVKTDFKELIDGVFELRDNSDKKRKYDYLLKYLDEEKLFDVKEKKVNDHIFKYPFEKKITFIIPKDKESLIRKFNNESEKNTYKLDEDYIITFDDIIKKISKYNDKLSIEFRKSLEDWKKDAGS